MKNPKTLKSIIDAYDKIADILEDVLEKRITPRQATKKNLYLGDEIRSALSEAGYIKQ